MKINIRNISIIISIIILSFKLITPLNFSKNHLTSKNSNNILISKFIKDHLNNILRNRENKSSFLEIKEKKFENSFISKPNNSRFLELLDIIQNNDINYQIIKNSNEKNKYLYNFKETEIPEKTSDKNIKKIFTNNSTVK